VTTQSKNAHASVADIDAALAANDAEKPSTDGIADLPPGGTNGKPAAPASRSRRRTTKAADAGSDKADEAPPTDVYKLKAFTSRDVPWGKLGTITEETHDAKRAAELGGLNFEVELLEAGFRTSGPPRVGQSPWRSVASRRACVRTDTQQFFSFVSKDYSPVQYGDAFEYMNNINPTYVAAGALGGGRQGFMVVKLPDTDKIELKIGKTIDPLDMYVVLRTSHDLTRAIEVSVLMLRDKCMNALTLNSFTQGAVQHWSVKHVGKDPVAKLAAATNTLNRSNAYMKSFIDTAKVLADIQLTMEDAENVLRRVLPDKPKREDQVRAIIHAWRDEETGGYPTNGWGLVNGVSGYFEWGRNDGTRTDQSRFTGALTGSTHRYINRTAQLLMQRRR
jgi:phage/plasmid-like protein (TIGR03299 family)